MENLTKQQMIKDLTIYELEFLIHNKEYISEIAKFFSEGGYNSYNEDDLLNAWNKKIK